MAWAARCSASARVPSAGTTAVRLCGGVQAKETTGGEFRVYRASIRLP